jgi:hypothetical protein
MYMNVAGARASAALEADPDDASAAAIAQARIAYVILMSAALSRLALLSEKPSRSLTWIKRPRLQLQPMNVSSDFAFMQQLIRDRSRC